MIPLGVMAGAHVAPAGGGGLTVTYLGTTEWRVNQSAGYQFTANVDIGPAAPDRNIVAYVAGRPDASATVNGVTLTQDITGTQSTSGTILHANVPTGSGPVEVVYTFPASSWRSTCHLFAVHGATALIADETLIVEPLDASTASLSPSPGATGVVGAHAYTSTVPWASPLGFTQEWNANASSGSNSSQGGVLTGTPVQVSPPASVNISLAVVTYRGA